MEQEEKVNVLNKKNIKTKKLNKREFINDYIEIEKEIFERRAYYTFYKE